MFKYARLSSGLEVKLFVLRLAFINFDTEKPVLSGHSKEDKKYVFKTDNYIMQLKSIAECTHGAFCSIFDLHEATA